MRLIPILACTLLFAARPAAQTVDVHDFLPLGVFNAWNLAEVGAPDQTAAFKTNRVDLVDGRLEYRVRAPFLGSMREAKLSFASEGDQLLLTRALFQDAQSLDFNDELDSFKLSALHFDPPIVLGDTDTEVGVSSFESDVDTQFTARAKAGPIREKIEFDVTGTITSNWLAAPSFPDGGNDLEFPVGDAAERVAWQLIFDLDLEATEDGELFDAQYVNTLHVLLGEGLGPMVVTGAGATQHALQSVIAPGVAEGPAFDLAPELDPGLSELDVDIDDLFFFQDGVDAPGPIADEALELDQLELFHELNGRAVLSGVVSTAGGGEQMPFEMKGRLRTNAAKQTAQIDLKGKLKGLFEKGLKLRAKGPLTPDSTSFVVSYRSGKEIAGELELPIAAQTADSVSVSLAPLVDRDFKPKKDRRLGAEGELTVGDVSYGVTMFEKRRVPGDETKPTRHNYLLKQTGLKSKLFKLKAVDTEEEGYVARRFVGKLFGGTRIVLPAPAQELEVEDVVGYDFGD